MAIAGDDPFAARLYRTDKCPVGAPFIDQDRVDAVAALPDGLVVAIARDPSGEPSVDHLYQVSPAGEVTPLLGEAPSGLNPVAGPDGTVAWTTAFEPEPQPPFAVYALGAGQGQARALYRSRVPLLPIAVGPEGRVAVVEQPSQGIDGDQSQEPATLVLLKDAQVWRRKLLSPGRVTGVTLSADGQSLSVSTEGQEGFRESLATGDREVLPAGWRVLDYEPGTHDLLLVDDGGRLGTLMEHAPPEAIRAIPDLGVGPVYEARYVRSEAFEGAQNDDVT